MSPSEAVEHAIVFSNLRADGPAPRFAPLRRALAAAPAAAQGELILAGGTFVGAGADEGALAALGEVLRAARVGRLCLLAGAGEAAALQAARPHLAERLGLGEEQVSFGAPVARGLTGRALRGAQGSVVVLAREGVDPLRGQELTTLLCWPGLRGFVRAWTKQLEMRVTLRDQETPEQRLAQALALAVATVAEGKPERGQAALDALLQKVREGGPLDGEAAALWRGLQAQLGRALIAAARFAFAGGDAAAVVVGQSPATAASEGAPQVVLFGAEDEAYVVVELTGGAKATLHGADTAAVVMLSRAEPAKVEPAKAEPAKAEPAKVEPAKVEAEAEASKVEAPAETAPSTPAEAPAEEERAEAVESTASAEPAADEPAAAPTSDAVSAAGEPAAAVSEPTAGESDAPVSEPADDAGAASAEASADAAPSLSTPARGEPQGQGGGKGKSGKRGRRD